MIQKQRYYQQNAKFKLFKLKNINNTFFLYSNRFHTISYDHKTQEVFRDVGRAFENNLLILRVSRTAYNFECASHVM